ncbi:MAG: GNAT family N-acetyltransferase [Candidatus Azobacteroides sp.]|nr:GNAT family N-acetyltransferase [Candidatus Azobacteroides sp.]
MNETIIFRKAVPADIERIWQIILQAKERMRLRGALQWQDGYPAIENITGDIEKGYGYVLCYDNCVIAYAAVVFDGEQAYNSIAGNWLSDQPYVVVHRLAIAEEMTQHGIASLFMGKVEELSRRNGVFSFRVDTNFDNQYMLKILKKSGFTYCGEVFYDSGARMAYEKIL